MPARHSHLWYTACPWNVLIEFLSISFVQYKTSKMSLNKQSSLYQKIEEMNKSIFHIPVFHISTIWVASSGFESFWRAEYYSGVVPGRFWKWLYKHVSSITLKRMCTLHSEKTFIQEEMERFSGIFFVDDWSYFFQKWVKVYFGQID